MLMLGLHLDHGIWSPLRFAYPAADDASGDHMDQAIPDWVPVADVTESEHEYLIKAELPEVRKEDLSLTVQDGVLTSYLHDAISARHYKVAATGNGRRESYRYPPLPRMRSTYMLPGPHDKDEIIRSVKKGIYCQTFSNGQVQIGAGDFTFYVKLGYLIENGKIRNYQCVVPTTWNASPRDGAGNIGAYEAALKGTKLAVVEQPLEILRTIHSFDPCIACAVHVTDPDGEELVKVKIK